MKLLIAYTQGRTRNGFLLICSIAGFATSGPAVIICDNPVSVRVLPSFSTLSILSSSNLVLHFTLDSAVGNITHLGLVYSGTATNGIDVQTLPATVIIPAGHSVVDLPIKPQPNYPFSTKSLVVRINSSDNVCVEIGSPQAATITFIGFDPPSLQAASRSPTNLLLSWWAPVTGYALQYSDTPTSGNWLTDTNVNSQSQGANSVILNLTNPARFYRLMKP